MNSEQLNKYNELLNKYNIINNKYEIAISNKQSFYSSLYRKYKKQGNLTHTIFYFDDGSTEDINWNNFNDCINDEEKSKWVKYVNEVDTLKNELRSITSKINEYKNRM